MERPHKVPSYQCTHLEVIPQHGDAERHQLSPAFFEALGALALFAVLALSAARGRSETVPGEEAEEGEDGGGEEQRLFVGEEGGVLGKKLEQAGVAWERHAAEEGGEEARVGDEHAEVEVDGGGDPRLEHEGAQLDGLDGVEVEDEGFERRGVHG